MASLDSKVGTITSPVATGNQAISGLGFTPKVVILFGQQQSTGLASVHQFAVGVFDGTTQWSGSSYTLDGSNPWQTHPSDSLSHVYRQLQAPAAAVHLAASFVSMDADGFTINWATVNAVQQRIMYLALAGSDLQAKLGTFNVSTTVASQAITGVGFQPQCTLFFAGTSNNSTTQQHVVLGAAMSSTNRWSNHFVNNSVTSAKQRQNTTLCAQRRGTADAVTYDIDFTSNNADGFTLDVEATGGGASINVQYLCLRGVQLAIGAFNSVTGVASQGVTGVGFTPQALYLTGFGIAASTSQLANAKKSVGIADSGLLQRTFATRIEEGVAAAQTGHYRADDKIWSTVDDSGAEALTSDAALTSYDADGFTLNWTTNDGVAKQILYLAMAGNAAASVPKRLMLLGVGA